MAKCPSCDCELAGMERICKSCFAKQYADPTDTPATGFRAKDFIVPVIVGVLLAVLWYEGMLRFPGQMTTLHRGFGLSIRVMQTIFAVMAAALGILDSLKWRSGQNFLFWVLASLNIVAMIMWWLQRGEMWLFFLVLTYLLSKGLSFYWKRQTA